MSLSVADPGFPRGGGANSPGGAPTYDFAKISQTLHEIERIWTRGASLVPPYIRHCLSITRIQLIFKQLFTQKIISFV